MKLNDGSSIRIHYEYFKDRISQFSELKYLIEEVDKKKELTMYQIFLGQVFIDVYFLDYSKHIVQMLLGEKYLCYKARKDYENNTGFYQGVGYKISKYSDSYSYSDLDEETSDEETSVEEISESNILNRIYRTYKETSDEETERTFFSKEDKIFELEMYSYEFNMYVSYKKTNKTYMQHILTNLGASKKIYNEFNIDLTHLELKSIEKEAEKLKNEVKEFKEKLDKKAEEASKAAQEARIAEEKKRTETRAAYQAKMTEWESRRPVLESL